MPPRQRSLMPTSPRLPSRPKKSSTRIALGGSSLSRIGRVPDHLMSATVPLLQADDAVRIAHVRAPRWISHPAAGAAHDAMRLLLERPPSLRPRGLLLAGPYHNGKTMIA